jgi:CHASE2 domain-containing sensor protein
MRQSQGRRRLHIALFLGVGLATTGLGLVAYGTNVFRELDLQSVDARFSLRGTTPPREDIVVVRIDDVTFDALDRRWEEFRPFHARVSAG